MQRRRLGSTDIAVSVLGVGCNSFGVRTTPSEVDAIVAEALAHGINFFDTADVYGQGRSEELLGAAVRGRRGEVVIATKFGLPMSDSGDLARNSKAYVRRALENSLRRLGTDHIDLYQLHQHDGVTPLEDVLAVLDEAVQAGHVRAVGSSNLAAWQITDAHWLATSKGTVGFASAQHEYSLYCRDAELELIPACMSKGISMLAYFPLAAGLLTGKYADGAPAPSGSRMELDQDRFARVDWRLLEELAEFARSSGAALLEVALGGLAAKPGVASVLAGVSRVGQVATNARAVDWRPSTEAAAVLERIGYPGAGGRSTSLNRP